MPPKTTITQKEFNDEFEIKEITEETEKASSKQDTTPKPEPEFLTEEEQEFDNAMHADNIDEEIKE